MAKKKISAKKKTCPKKTCSNKCESQSKTEGISLPEKPQTKSNFFFGLIKKVFGHE